MPIDIRLLPLNNRVIFEIKNRHIPLGLINARIEKKTFDAPFFFTDLCLIKKFESLNDEVQRLLIDRNTTRKDKL